MKPLRDFVFVKKLEEKEQRTQGGLFVPGTSENKNVEAEVVAVGEGYVTTAGNVVTLTIKVGDKVLYPRSVGVDVKVNGEDLVVLREDSVFCVLW